jgi:hypothetical protein
VVVTRNEVFVELLGILVTFACMAAMVLVWAAL